MLRSGYYRVLSWDSDLDNDDWKIAENPNVPTDENGNQYFGYGCLYNIKSYIEHEDEYENVVLMDESIVFSINKDDAIIMDNLL